MGKVYLLIGLAVGYVIGTAAGRQQFDKIKAKLGEVRDNPDVKRAVKKADDFVAEKAPAVHDIAEAATDAASGTNA